MRMDMDFLKNKKGQGLSTSAIILIILGVFILVILILGFITGWDIFKGIFPGGGDNVDTIIQACQRDCMTKSGYGFCSQTKELKADGDTYEGSCYTFAVADGFNYGIEECGDLDCKSFVTCDDWGYTKDGEEMQAKVTVGGEDMTANYCG